jgi:RNA polymerase sigma-70 factor (ECF subfamily)
MAAASEATSSSLLERVKTQDPQGWRRLLALYGPLVYHWARQWGLQDQDASDIVQEVFHKVATHIGSFRRDRHGDSFRGWLWTITRNKVRDHYRAVAARREAVGGSELREQLEQVPELPAEERSMNKPDDDALLVRAAAELVRGEFEQRTWEFFWKVAVDGQSVADVAADAGVSDSAVYKAKSRVLKRLREELAETAD